MFLFFLRNTPSVLNFNIFFIAEEKINYIFFNICIYTLMLTKSLFII